MNKRILFKELNKLCREMSELYDINNGGCCFVAACLAEQLEKYNISYKVCCVIEPTHYCIKVSDRFINRDSFCLISSEILELNSRSLYWIYYEGNWNDVYNKKWNMIVKSKIKSIFKRNENRGKRLFHGTVRRDKCKV